MEFIMMRTVKGVFACLFSNPNCSQSLTKRGFNSAGVLMLLLRMDDAAARMMMMMMMMTTMMGSK